MPTEKHTSQNRIELGQEVLDSYGNRIGKVQARFDRYILVETGGLFGKAYYLPVTLIKRNEQGAVFLSINAGDTNLQDYKALPDDLYDEVPDPGIPQVFSGVPKIAKRPLSPAQTGHYNYGRRWPGINTDAAGSYHRDEVLPIPQKLVEVADDQRRK